MKKKALLIASLSLGVLVTSCKKETPVKTSIPTTAEWTKLLDENLTSMKQTANFDASNTNFVLTTKKGSTITINGTCLRLNGSPVSGNVVLEVVEMYENTDMALTNKTTIGINPTTKEKEQLETGGMFYVMAKKDGKELTTTCGIQIDIAASNTGGIKTGMQAFEGKIESNELTWETSTKFEVIPSSSKGLYTMVPPGFGWFNCDRFYNDSRPKTSITAQVPNGYGSNSVVYILTKSYPGSLGGLLGKYPIGLDCWLLFVSMKDGKYMWETKQTTLTANHTEKFDLSTAQTGSKSDYVGHVTLLR